MTTKTGKRIYRAATPEEKVRHQEIREQIKEELPELQQRARQKLAEIIQQGVDIHQIIALLKAERIKKGLTLAQVNKSTGLEAALLMQLEESTDANPTLNIITRYAEAIGTKVLVVLADTDA
ncbi:MAG: hypothetical protein U0350_11680 [Caldilineaceae bacterium]